MKKKRPSLHAFKKKKKEARRRKRRSEAFEAAKLMTDSKLQELASEKFVDLVHTQARKVLAARQEAKRKEAQHAMPKKRRQRKTQEQGCPPPVIAEFAEPDWWREE